MRIAQADWNDIRRKAWHLSLALAAAYAATRPALAWSVPVLTMAASVSESPTKHETTTTTQAARS